MLSKIPRTLLDVKKAAKMIVWAVSDEIRLQQEPYLIYLEVARPINSCSVQLIR